MYKMKILNAIFISLFSNYTTNNLCVYNSNYTDTKTLIAFYNSAIFNNNLSDTTYLNETVAFRAIYCPNWGDLSYTKRTLCDMGLYSTNGPRYYVDYVQGIAIKMPFDNYPCFPEHDEYDRYSDGEKTKNIIDTING